VGAPCWQAAAGWGARGGAGRGRRGPGGARAPSAGVRAGRGSGSGVAGRRARGGGRAQARVRGVAHAGTSRCSVEKVEYRNPLYPRDTSERPLLPAFNHCTGSSDSPAGPLNCILTLPLARCLSRLCLCLLASSALGVKMDSLDDRAWVPTAGRSRWRAQLAMGASTCSSLPRVRSKPTTPTVTLRPPA